ncbi:transketolase C-terminal domain-containing protein [Pseudoflavonifractor phocaeensis]|jgi:transketolase|uniref:transketolase family protein n=1 Tax=Pseudoflavonifractor phocaeensis TaxID=1870988 RepID=UPI0025A48891|nr:transketolase C-terminal domain-containing protein [Pseudoflavonifractor phocaeensis]MDM8239832.1 transketolase C-terminal domain-containing protein [Pseudoflavonifractor phocaeensis]
MAKAIREVYGEALVKYGKDNPDVVVLDADVSGSTKSAIFGKACPDRFFNMGIAEANMTAAAAGMASVGKIPFVNTFAVFLTTIGLLPARALGSYSKVNIKMAGAYGGMSDAFDGPSHHALEDIAVMRTLPNFKVFVPCDAAQTEWVVKNAIEDPSPMYIRLSRDVFPDVYAEGETFEEGKGRIVRDGTDATVIACGLMVGNAMAAAEELAKEGISLRVVDMFCIKPLDEELVVRCAKETGAIISAEEHSIIGGLGGAVSEALCKAGAQVPMGFVGTNDLHGECGPYKQLQAKYGLDAAAIVAKVKETISKK